MEVLRRCDDAESVLKEYLTLKVAVQKGNLQEVEDAVRALRKTRSASFFFLRLQPRSTILWRQNHRNAMRNVRFLVLRFGITQSIDAMTANPGDANNPISCIVTAVSHFVDVIAAL